jgi:PAS domain S-box-containing protein
MSHKPPVSSAPKGNGAAELRTLRTQLAALRQENAALRGGLDQAKQDCAALQISLELAIEETRAARADVHASEAANHALRRANARLATSEAARRDEVHFRTLADTAPALLWVTNTENRCTYLSRSWYEFTGQTPLTGLGYGWLSAVHPEDSERSTAIFLAAAERREPFELEYRLRRADGHYRWAIDAGRPHFAEDGEYLGYVGSVTDVHERIQTAEQLARHRTELERLVEERTAALLREVEERRRAEEALRQGEKLQALGQLTGGIAHDFNNILQVVTSGATLLQHPHLSEERRAAVLAGMSKATESARELTGRLLAFARKQVLQPEAFDLNARVGNMAALLRGTLGSRIRVEVDLAPDLWPVHADPGQLEVAVLNLATNARDAMLPDGGVITLQTRIAQLGASAERGAGEYVCLAVTDTGQGMTPAVLARVFEPFFTTKGPDRGTGLGLAQVHGFAKQSGGDIAVESTQGRGTTITLHLPRATANQIDAPKIPASTTGAVIERTAGRTVLVVEDNPDVASFAAGMLEGLGYTTRRAGSADEALALMNAGEAPDVVFSDVVMPGAMNGVQLASHLRQRWPHLGVVLATGYSETLTDLRGKAVAEVLGKPYRLEELAAALDRALATADPSRRTTGSDAGSSTD